MDNEDKVLEEWCKNEGLDYLLALSLKDAVFPLLEEAHKKLGSLFDRLYLEQKTGIETRLENSAQLLKILYSLDKNKFSPEEVKAVSLHLEFLPLVEGFFSTQIDFLIFILLANGHDLYSSRKGEYAKTLGEIEEVDLAFKLKFLKEHGFKELIKEESIFRHLRNSVAHMSYEIEPNCNVEIGNIIVTGENYTKLYEYLRKFSFSIFNIQKLYYEKYMESLKPEDITRIQNHKLTEVVCGNCGYINLAVASSHVLGFEPTLCAKCLKELKPSQRKNQISKPK